MQMYFNLEYFGLMISKVVQFLGISSKPKICIITEFLPHGTVHSLLVSTVHLDMTTILRLCLGTAAGMHHLHCENILHR
jgi:hypothetical protein